MAGESERDAAGSDRRPWLSGPGLGEVETVLAVDEVERQAGELAAGAVDRARLEALVRGEPYLVIDSLRAGYGKMEILHRLDLLVGSAQSLCLIGPNGAGKSTVLNSIFGFTNIFTGRITVAGRDVTRLSAQDKLRSAGVAYVLQDSSIFPTSRSRRTFGWAAT